MVIILQNIQMSDHYTVHLKLMQCCMSIITHKKGREEGRKGGREGERRKGGRRRGRMEGEGRRKEEGRKEGRNERRREGGKEGTLSDGLSILPTNQVKRKVWPLWFHF